MQRAALHRVQRSVLFLPSPRMKISFVGSFVHMLNWTHLQQDSEYDANERSRIRVVSDLYTPQTYPRNNIFVHRRYACSTRYDLEHRQPKNANRISHGTNKFNFRFILAVFKFSLTFFLLSRFYLSSFENFKVYYTHLESPHVPWVASIFQTILITL